MYINAMSSLCYFFELTNDAENKIKFEKELKYISSDVIYHHFQILNTEIALSVLDKDSSVSLKVFKNFEFYELGLPKYLHKEIFLEDIISTLPDFLKTNFILNLGRFYNGTL